MSTNTARTSARPTVASLAADVASLTATVDALVAALTPAAPAQPARKAARKPATRKSTKSTKAQVKTVKAAPAPKATKGETALRTGAGMTKAAWNKTLATKARLAGKRDGASVYSLVMADWSEVQALRASGCTPDEVLGLYV